MGYLRILRREPPPPRTPTSPLPAKPPRPESTSRAAHFSLCRDSELHERVRMCVHLGGLGCCEGDARSGDVGGARAAIDDYEVVSAMSTAAPFAG